MLRRAQEVACEAEGEERAKDGYQAIISEDGGEESKET